MKYRIFSYELTDRENRIIGPDRHFEYFNRSVGYDPYRGLAEYRRKKDSILMQLRRYQKDFSGLIGRHSTERIVASYNQNEDIVLEKKVTDDDYPHTPFICFPRLGTIACIEGRPIKANSAMSRLHAILNHHSSSLFYVRSAQTASDLRKAVKHFSVTEVKFEVLPVNPHTGPLGERTR